MYAEAVAAFDKGIALLGDEGLFWRAPLARAHGLAGSRDEATRILAELLALDQGSYVSAAGIAWVYLALSQHNEAIDWLRRGLSATRRRHGLAQDLARLRPPSV